MKNTTFILLMFFFLTGGVFFAFLDQKNQKKASSPSDLQENNGAYSNIPQSLSSNKEIFVFFGNSGLNPNSLDCSLVFPVKRMVENKPVVANLALKKLIQGPNEWEKLHGYYNSISGARILSFKIENTIAIVDFENLPNGGSCIVQNARSQIEKTLSQFYDISDVVILQNGISEGVLEP